MTERLTRQQLYERIRAASKDEVILEEMVRLGFWDAGAGKPGLPEQTIARMGEIERELRALAIKQRAHEDPEKALALLRKERLAEARRRRAENKLKRVEERHARALAWHERRGREVLYLGEGVSRELGRREADTARLQAQGLPVFGDAPSVAEAMGISLAELRFLAYHREVSEVSHYRRFRIPKKTGGERLISAPMPRLKRAQYWVLANIVDKLAVHDAAHGFVRERSIVTNARPHAGRAMVVNIDLENFFPSIGYGRVKGLFRALGYSAEVATVLALLTTEADTDEVELDGQVLFIARGERRLPQGAPTSPAIANRLCRRLDARLTGIAAHFGFRYTRYADDLSFSAPREAAGGVGQLLWSVRQVIAAEGFAVNAAKTRVMRRGARHEVTGVVVNGGETRIERARLRRFRALVHQVERDGPDGKHWEGRDHNLLDVMHGFASFVHMVDPAKGTPLLRRVRALTERHPLLVPRAAGPLYGPAFRHAAMRGQAPREDWWQPLEKPAPALLLPPAPPAALERARATGGGRAADSPVGETLDGDDRPLRHVGTLWRLIELALKVLIVFLAFRVGPLFGSIVAAYFVVRAILRRRR